jgi:hypothetical protein
MAKNRVAFVLLLGTMLISSVFGQPTGEDFLPLAIGNTWSYNYFASATDLFIEATTSDSGTATYLIVSKRSSPDSTIWSFLECREGAKLHFSFASGQLHYSSTPLKDTASFDLVEYHSANHRVVRAGYTDDVWKSVFCLIPAASDSTRFFRYLPGDGSDTLVVVARWWYDAYQLRFTFRQGIGITRAEYSNPKITGGHSQTQHTLKSQTLVSVGLASQDVDPMGFTLNANYPNPFNPQTTLSFSIGSRDRVAVTICDLLGRHVATVYDDVAQPGTHSVVWDAFGVPSGTYFCIARTTSATKCSKLLLVK